MAEHLSTTQQQFRSKKIPNSGSSQGVNRMNKQIALKTEKKANNTIFLEHDLSETSQVQRLTVDMPSDLHREFKIWCVMHNLKMNELIRYLIRETIKA